MVIAVASYTRYGQEDTLIVNQSKGPGRSISSMCTRPGACILSRGRLATDPRATPGSHCIHAAKCHSLMTEVPHWHGTSAAPLPPFRQPVLTYIPAWAASESHTLMHAANMQRVHLSGPRQQGHRLVEHPSGPQAATARPQATISPCSPQLQQYACHWCNTRPTHTHLCSRICCAPFLVGSAPAQRQEQQ